jgi:hypothetical protein
MPAVFDLTGTTLLELAVKSNKNSGRAGVLNLSLSNLSSSDDELV